MRRSPNFVPLVTAKRAALTISIRSSTFRVVYILAMLEGALGNIAHFGQRPWSTHPCLMYGHIGVIGESNPSSLLTNPSVQVSDDGEVDFTASFDNQAGKHSIVRTLCYLCGKQTLAPANNSAEQPPARASTFMRWIRLPKEDRKLINVIDPQQGSIAGPKYTDPRKDSRDWRRLSVRGAARRDKSHAIQPSAPAGLLLSSDDICTAHACSCGGALAAKCVQDDFASVIGKSGAWCQHCAISIRGLNPKNCTIRVTYSYVQPIGKLTTCCQGIGRCLGHVGQSQAIKTWWTGVFVRSLAVPGKKGASCMDMSPDRPLPRRGFLPISFCCNACQAIHASTEGAKTMVPRPGPWTGQYRQAHVHNPTGRRESDTPKKWRTPPKWKYKIIRGRKKPQKQMPHLEFTKFVRGCVGPKSGRDWNMQQPAASHCSPVSSARVECVALIHSEPPPQLVHHKKYGAGSSGQSKQNPVSRTSIKPGRIVPCILLLAQQVAQSTAVKTNGPVQTLSTDLSRTCKRSYIRAVRRAEAQGHTWYKGKLCTVNALKSQYQGNGVEKVFRRPTRTYNVPRLRVMSINVGGLSTDAYDELMHRLQSQPEHIRPQVVLLQETHWKDSRDFQTPGWFVTHSALHHQNKAGGVAALVSDKLVAAHDIRVDEPFPGRLQHLRLFLVGCTVDVLNVYQKVNCNGSSPAQKERNQVWEQLDGALKRIPKRHVCVVAGDLNTPMAPLGGQTGPKLQQYNVNVPADQSRLVQIALDHQLAHLNSWIKQTTATYVAPKSQTLIDHIFTAQATADSVSRKASTVDLQLFAWRLGGRHLPIQASVPLPHVQKLNRPRPAGPRIVNSVGLAYACRDPDNAQIHKMRTAVQIRMQAEHPDVDQMNLILREEAINFFPGKKKQGQIVPWKQQTVGISVKQMWIHYRAWKTSSSASMAKIFKTWENFTKFKKAHASFKAAGKHERKLWLQAQLQQMEQAARRKDTRTLFNLAKRVAPKSKRTTIQMRDEDGHILSKQQEVDKLQEYYEGLFSHELDLPPPVHKPIQLDLGFEELEKQFKQLSAFKAAPATLAPAAMWKACREDVIPWLATHSQDLAAIPQKWKDSHIALIPKVARPTLPRQLRPIGLTEISGRIVAGVIQERLRPHVAKYLDNLPQFAYLPGRSTHDAIRRAQAHCADIYKACRGRGSSVLEKYRGCAVKRQPRAGLQISLDLSQAFDRMERTFLDASMQDAEVPGDLQAIVMQWMESVKYHIPYQGLTCEINSTRGVRQGCKISPLLWAMFTGLFMRRLASLIDISWVIEKLTAYADDFHTTHTAHTVKELDDELGKLGVMFDLLAKMGMKVNPKKSAALFRVRGSFAKKWLQRHTVQTAEGKALQIKCPSGMKILIPIRDEHVYLGVKISFHKISTPTAQHRQQIAAAAWSRLRPILCKRSLLGVQHRVQIWRACVPATILHGLASSHIREDDFRRLRIFMIKQIRAIARSPAHLYHESTEDLLSRLRIPDPWEMLLQEAEQQLSAWKERAEHSPQSITACPKAGSLLQESLERIRRRQVQQTRSEETGREPRPSVGKHTCPVCGHEATTHRLNKVHQARIHGLKVGQRIPLKFNRAVHAKQGLPICALCHREFNLWTNLEKHITTGRCPGVENGGALRSEALQTELETQPLACRPELMQKVRQQGWQALTSDRPLCSLLMHHCVLCHQWAASASGLKKHMSTHHPEWEQLMPQMLSMAALTKSSITRPCKLCLQSSFDKGRHWKQCQVVLSLTLLEILAKSGPNNANANGGARKIFRVPSVDDQTGGRGQLGLEKEKDYYPSRDVQSRQRRREEQRNGKATGQKVLSELFRRKRIDDDDGAPPAEARAHPQCSPGGQHVSPLPEERGGKPHRPTLQGRANVEEDQRGATAGVTAEPQGVPSEVLVGRIQGSAGELPEDGISRSVRQGSRMVQSGRMALRSVERRGGEDQDSEREAHQKYGGSSRRHLDASATHGGLHPQVLRHQTANRKSGDPLGGVPVGGVAQRRWNPSLGSAPDLGGLASSSTSWSQVAPGETRIKRPSPGTAERDVTTPAVDVGNPAIHMCATRRSILEAIFHNPGNHCYMNHTVLCLLWCQICLGLPDFFMSPLLKNIQTSLKNYPVMALMQHMPWTCLISDWVNPNRQHDAVEFAAHVLQRLRWGQTMGQWEARILVSNSVQIRDRRTTQSPISLPLNPGEPSLNASVQLWHSQAAIHALRNRVPLVCLHLLRFQQAPGGRWVKDQRELQWQDTVLVPCFQNPHSLEILWLPYKVVAISLHVGMRPDVGHYKAVLIDEGIQWETDDHRTAKRVVTPSPDLRRQADMFWCVLEVDRQQMPPEATLHMGNAMRTSLEFSSHTAVRRPINPKPSDAGPQVDTTSAAAHPTQDPSELFLSTQSYAEVEGYARSGGTLHCAHWQTQHPQK